MTPEAARDLIVALVGHGFDRQDLMEMSGAELLFWSDGLSKHNKAKADAQRRAAEKGKPPRPRARKR